MASLPEHLSCGDGCLLAGYGSLTLNRIPVTKDTCLARIVRKLTLRLHAILRFGPRGSFTTMQQMLGRKW
jgi:hypothetical protein